MGIKLGMEAKIYLRAAGGDAALTDAGWLEFGNVRDATLEMTKGAADVTTRGNNGWRAKLGTLKEGKISIQSIWDTDDERFAELFSAFMSGDNIGVAILDGAKGTTGSEGLKFNGQVLKCSRGEALEEGITADIEIEPGYSTYAPEWVTVA